jgi:hypothetical protein
LAFRIARLQNAESADEWLPKRLPIVLIEERLLAGIQFWINLG